MNSVWPRNETMPSQELLISSSTDYHSKLTADEKSLPKIPYKKACERPPVSVARRNARERKRVHTVNQMFSILKTRLPSLHQKTKRVSKLKILKAAMDYIYDLQDILDGTNAPQPSTTNDHLRSSLVSECFYPNQQQVEKIPTFGGVSTLNGPVVIQTQHQQPSASTVVGENCHQSQKYCGPKWGTLSLPAVPVPAPADQQGPPPLSSFSDCNRDSFCQIPTFLTDNNSYDPKYYYYSNQGYQY